MLCYISSHCFGDGGNQLCHSSDTRGASCSGVSKHTRRCKLLGLWVQRCPLHPMCTLHTSRCQWDHDGGWGWGGWIQHHSSPRSPSAYILLPPVAPPPLHLGAPRQRGYQSGTRSRPGGPDWPSWPATQRHKPHRHKPQQCTLYVLHAKHFHHYPV